MFALIFALAACVDKDTDDSNTPVETWTVLGEDLPGGLLSLYATDTSNVWTVGGDIGSGPLVLHYDGAAWTKVETGSSGDLWWVWGDGSEVWMVGAASRVLRVAANGDISESDLGAPTVTLFGIWGSGPSDIWTVGGDINLASDGARVWHYDGAAWTEVELPAEAAARTAMYKVWGTGPSDAWIVGGGGIALHWDGSAWTSVPTGMDRTLFTISGDDQGVYAVGGQISGAILRYDGAAWSDETPDFTEQQNGVSARAGCDAASVGVAGSVFSRQGGVWTADARSRGTFLDLHGAWVDPDCAIWAVGGAITSFPLSQGVVLYGGGQDIPPIAL